MASVIAPGNLVPETQFTFLCSDFESCWDALAQTKTPTQGGGNFMFARQAMALLELCCRVAAADETGGTLSEFGSALAGIDGRYFTKVPGRVPAPRQFRLPRLADTDSTDAQLLEVLYDLVRQGHAHLYQQIPVRMSDGGLFGIALTGVDRGAFLSSMTVQNRPRDHLSLRVREGEAWLVAIPAALYLDLRDAAIEARVFGRNLLPKYFTRPGAGKRAEDYGFTTGELLGVLCQAGHPIIGDPKPTVRAPIAVRR
jgi:hypothetical protein